MTITVGGEEVDCIELDVKVVTQSAKSAGPQIDYGTLFTMWQQQHNKLYSSSEERQVRFAIWKDRLQNMQRQNGTQELMAELSDLTATETRAEQSTQWYETH